MSKGRIALCPRCNKMRRDNSPYSFVWWRVLGFGLMCWHCFDRLKK